MAECAGARRSANQRFRVLWRGGVPAGHQPTDQTWTQSLWAVTFFTKNQLKAGREAPASRRLF